MFMLGKNTLKLVLFQSLSAEINVVIANRIKNCSLGFKIILFANS